jgi:hypothetical protein
MPQVNSARVNVRAVLGRSCKYARFEHVVPQLRAQGECVSLSGVFVFAFQIKISFLNILLTWDIFQLLLIGIYGMLRLYPRILLAYIATYILDGLWTMWITRYRNFSLEIPMSSKRGKPLVINRVTFSFALFRSASLFLY